MDAKEAKEIIRAGFAWANWTEEQKQAFKLAYDAIDKVEHWKKESEKPKECPHNHVTTSNHGYHNICLDCGEEDI